MRISENGFFPYLYYSGSIMECITHACVSLSSGYNQYQYPDPKIRFDRPLPHPFTEIFCSQSPSTAKKQTEELCLLIKHPYL